MKRKLHEVLPDDGSKITSLERLRESRKWKVMEKLFELGERAHAVESKLKLSLWAIQVDSAAVLKDEVVEVKEFGPKEVTEDYDPNSRVRKEQVVEVPAGGYQFMLDSAKKAADQLTTEITPGWRQAVLEAAGISIEEWGQFVDAKTDEERAKLKEAPGAEREPEPENN